MTSTPGIHRLCVRNQYPKYWYHIMLTWCLSPPTICRIRYITRVAILTTEVWVTIFSVHIAQVVCRCTLSPGNKIKVCSWSGDLCIHTHTHTHYSVGTITTIALNCVFLLCSAELHPLAYKKPPPKYAAEAILKILLNPYNITTAQDLCYLAS